VIRSKKGAEGRKYERNHSTPNINGFVNPCKFDRIDVHGNISDVLRIKATHCILQ
jgi:hypothetical protein